MGCRGVLKMGEFAHTDKAGSASTERSAAPTRDPPVEHVTWWQEMSHVGRVQSIDGGLLPELLHTVD